MESSATPLQFGPPRDRRQKKRVMTLRNGKRLLVVAVVLFIAMSVASELRGPKPGQFGRLFEARTIDPQVPRQKVTVVEEAPVAPASADPLLVEGLKREEILGVDEPVTAPIQTDSNEDATFSQADSYKSMRETERLTPRRQGSQWVITGGANGVVVQEQPDN